MNEGSNQQMKHPSTAQLLKASTIALLIALVVLVTAVLPAEYGKDPTGIGAALGLTALHAADEADAASSSKPAAAPAILPASPVAGQALPAHRAPAKTDPAQSFNLDAVRIQSSAFRNDEMSLTLEPGKGGEIKAKMQDGASFVFSWTAVGGPVNFDMHGEKPSDGDK